MESTNFVVCDESIGVIYEYHGSLYQLQMMNNLDILLQKYKFVEMDCKKDDNIWDDIWGDNFLAMKYVKNKLFGMKCVKWNKINSVKCGMFDFDNLKWRQLASLKLDEDSSFQATITK